MWIERPLAELPAHVAETFIRAVFAPDQHIARVVHHHYRIVLGHDEATARLETRVELERAAAALIANRERLLALGYQKVAVSWEDAGGAAAFQPVGLFGDRALTAVGTIYSTVLDAYANDVIARAA